MYLQNTIFSLVNTCLNSTFLSDLISNQACLMGQFDDLLVKLIFNPDSQSRNSIQDMKHNWLAAKQVLLHKVKKDKKHSASAPSAFNQVGIHGFM